MGTNLTRRSALGSLVAPALFAQTESRGEFKIGYRATSEGTSIVVLGEEGNWMIGIESSESADFASVDVFYEAHVKGFNGPLLLHKNSPSPVVHGVTAVTDQNFSVPLKDVRLIRVTLLQAVAQREFRQS